MYIFSQKQIQELMEIIDNHQMMFIGTNVGMDYLTDKEKNDFITEAGDVEKWRGNINEEQVDEHVKEVIKYLESQKVN